MYIIVALTAVVGLSILTSNRQRRVRPAAIGFSVAVFGTALWVLFTQLFRSATNEIDANNFHQVFAVVSLLMPLGFLSYATSLFNRQGWSIAVHALALLITVTVGCLLLLYPHLFYTEIVLAAGNNYAILASDSPLTLTYFSIFGTFMTVAIIMVIIKALKTKNNTNLRHGLIYFGCCMAVSSTFSSIFSAILPMLGVYDLFWLGPLSVAATMLFIYFTTLRFRLFVNSSYTLRYSIYLVAATIAAILYTCLFYLIFMLIFRGATPSDEITFFNFIMTVIIVLMLPSINHVVKYTKKIISENSDITESSNEVGKS
jgi:hypothetical protein